MTRLQQPVFIIKCEGTMIFKSFSIFLIYEVAVTSEQPRISTIREIPKTSVPSSSYNFNMFCFILFVYLETKIFCLKSLVSSSIQSFFFGLVPFSRIDLAVNVL